jgi:serine/threonine protein kinase
MLTLHGRSVFYSFSLTLPIFENEGTPGYVAPEILTAGSRVGYSNKVDVFSAGVTLYVMLCGYEPFYGETEKELIEANKNADIEFPETDWKAVSDDARDLVLKMTKADPGERFSAKDALQHPWMTRWVGDDLGASSGSHSGTRNMALTAADLPAEGACVIS